MKRKGIILACALMILTVCSLSGLSFLTGRATGGINILRAAEKMTINLHSNNGEDLVETMIVARADVETTNLVKNLFTKTGYTFTEWNTSSDGNGTSYADEAPVSSLSGTTVNLYAQWRVNEYTVTLRKNLDAIVYDDKVGEYELVERMYIPVGATAYIPNVNITSNTRIEYDFKVETWEINMRLLGVIGYWPSVFNVQIGTNKFIVYPPNDGSGEVPLSSIYDRIISVFEWTDGKTGTMSFYDASSGDLIASKTSQFNKYTVENTDLYLKAGADSEGRGSGYFYGLKIYEGEQLSKDIVPVKMEDGSAGLYDKVSKTLVFSSANCVPEGKVIFEDTVYTYTTDDEPFTIDTVLACEGMEFLGWADESGTPYNSITIDTFLMKNYVFTAAWRPYSFNLTVDLDDGSEPVTTSVEFNSALSSYLPELSKTGYDFLGYKTADGLSYTKMPAKDITLYAKWKMQTYTVSLLKNTDAVVYKKNDNFTYLESVLIPAGLETYINGVTLDSGTRIELDMQMTNTSDNARLIGISGSWDWVFNSEASSGSYTTYPGGNSINVNTSNRNTYIWNFSNNAISVYNNGSLKGSTTGGFNSYSTSNARLYIKGGGNQLSSGSGYFYGLKIYENDVLIKDIIPVLQNNGVCALYDNVSKQVVFSNSNLGKGEKKTFEGETITYTVNDSSFDINYDFTSDSATFLGWKDENDNLISNISIDTTTLRNYTFTATWQEKEKYALTFDFGGLEGYENYTVNLFAGVNITFPEVVKEGYLVKWLDADGNEYTKMPEQALTLYISMIDIMKDYIELEYIESNGSQYLNTGIAENAAYAFEMGFIPTGLNSSYQSYAGGTIDNFTLGAFGSKNYMYERRRGAEVSTSISLSTSTMNVITLEDNGSSIGTTGSMIYLFNNSTSSRASSMRLYYVWIKDKDGNVVRNFKPVVEKSSGTVGLLDIENLVFYSSPNGGKFSAGPSKKEFTLTFNFTGESGYEDYSVNYHYGDTITFPEVNIDGFVANWKDANGNTYTTMPGEDITLYLNLVEVAQIDGYFLLEKISANGSQYFDLGNTISQDGIAVYTKMSSNKFFFGTTGTGSYRSYLHSGEFGYGGDYGYTGVSINSNVHEIEASTYSNAQYLRVDGSSIGVGSYSQSTNNSYSFKIMSIGDQSTSSTGEIYWFYIYDVDGNYLKKLVPVLNSEGIAGLYDLVNKEFFASAGSGSFIAGEVYTSDEIDVDALVADIPATQTSSFSLKNEEQSVEQVIDTSLPEENENNIEPNEELIVDETPADVETNDEPVLEENVETIVDENTANDVEKNDEGTLENEEQNGGEVLEDVENASEENIEETLTGNEPTGDVNEEEIVE